MSQSSNGTRGTDPRTAGGSLPAGDKVGHFRIIEVLGQGGMGIVYLAEQEQPVRRQVALKVLQHEGVSERRLARFEAERQALALMNHPSIATVFEAGTSDEGTSYLAMEVVEGSPVLEFCDEHGLSVEERLQLFLQICDAVQHAHHKMVVHRDLKPSNVLVTMESGSAVPKLIDFGIAKSIQRPLVEQAGHTQEPMPVGTPLYISPEQIEGRVDLDARVDIYALGVLLYELMAGVLPLEVGEADAIAVMLRVLRQEPPRPSARFAELDHRLREQIASRRGTDAASLQRGLRGDLDWIITKAMERDRELRYPSASGLKSDVQRCLNHEPVLASPATVGYRISKFVRRNLAAVTVAAVVLLALVAGLTATTASMVRAKRARDAARLAERRATSTVEYLQKVLGSMDPGVDGRQVRVVDLLTKASEMIASDLADQPEVEASVRKTIGLTLLELGVFEESTNEIEKVIAIQSARLGPDHPETLHSINGLGRLLYKLGRYQEAADIHRSVLDKQTELLGTDDPETLWTMYNLAKALDRLEAWDEAEEIYRTNAEIRTRVLGGNHPDTLVTINSLSLFLARKGKEKEAEQLQRKNLESLVETLGDEHPDTLRASANLATILNLGKHPVEAEQLCWQSLPTLTRIFGPEHPETLGLGGQLARALHAQGRYDEAEAVCRRVWTISSARLGGNHPSTLRLQLLLGQELMHQGKLQEAEQLLADGAHQAAKAMPAGHRLAALLAAHYGTCLLVLDKTIASRGWLDSAIADLKTQSHRELRAPVEELIVMLEGWDKTAYAERFRRILEEWEARAGDS